MNTHTNITLTDKNKKKTKYNLNQSELISTIGLIITVKRSYTKHQKYNQLLSRWKSTVPLLFGPINKGDLCNL